MHRKHTAWKKNRKFGDIYGGRQRLRLSENIFRRAHNLKKPDENDELPILIEDNPSRDFFFPISITEALTALKSLPKSDYKGITHIWFRRIKKTDYEKGDVPFAEFICGSGVRVIVLYPFPKNMMLKLSAHQCSARSIKEYGRWCSNIQKKNGGTLFKWELSELRSFYINNLLYHEVGHHIDWYYRNWSRTNGKAVEEFADQYAIQKTATTTYIINNLEKKRKNENMNQDKT